VIIIIKIIRLMVKNSIGKRAFGFEYGTTVYNVPPLVGYKKTRS